MSRRKESVMPADLTDQLLAGGDAASALQQGGLLDSNSSSFVWADSTSNRGNQRGAGHSQLNTKSEFNKAITHAIMLCSFNTLSRELL
jgi:hypothetical protein